MRRKEGSSPTVACVEGGLSGGRAEDGQGVVELGDSKWWQDREICFKKSSLCVCVCVCMF